MTTPVDLAPVAVRPRRRVPRTLVVAVCAWVVAVALPVVVVQVSGRQHVVDLADAPPRTVALVLGAGLRPDGSPSTYLARRLDAAVNLYERRVVRGVLVSGDSSTVGYDEPTAMKDYLVRQGVPADVVRQDFAGLDTHDSAVRARAVFGVRDAIVVTQDYHLPRAVFSARAAGIDAVGVAVSSESVTPEQLATWKARDLLASWKAAVDALVGRKPARPWSDEPGVADVLAGR
ncbi:vancomycin high temperature exclusion protein [Sanguibacter sp. HDW7]|uniref:SanA/YdcF family protein n=1 Tax=Sanguibacter sp. HDW7 TaxID=2714931 RepID=UPI0014084F12|nr:ElyC/SanA/YdcF family protein [Sanguibacter sp. HDW7]QIK82232.1 DUF218 domain-containing protein [Sanguibacter sp. HDW7]